jgi:hypothetical protein
MRMTKRLVAALSLGFAFTGGALAASGQNNDGTWSVRLVTEAGSCDSSYNYAITVQNGAVRYQPKPGEAPTSVSGQIGPDGVVSLGFHRSIAKADAYGRLNGRSGAGTWQLAMLGCSGRWTAHKRTRTAEVE